MSRRPGTKTVNPTEDLTEGSTLEVPLGQLSGGNKSKEGYLKKYLPFEAVVVDSYTGSVRLRASITGDDFDPVPENSARTFDSVPVYTVFLKNPQGSGADVSKEDIELILFTSEERTASESGGFSLQRLAADVIPGYGVSTSR